jgi:hypothetical protein
VDFVWSQAGSPVRQESEEGRARSRAKARARNVGVGVGVRAAWALGVGDPSDEILDMKSCQNSGTWDN